MSSAFERQKCLTDGAAVAFLVCETIAILLVCTLFVKACVVFCFSGPSPVKDKPPPNA